jgi:hypothetical protein
MLVLSLVRLTADLSLSIALGAKDILRAQRPAIEWLLLNVFPVLGMCFPPGGLQFGVQMYNRRVTQTNAYLIALGVIANFLLPAAFKVLSISKATTGHRIAQTNRGASVILLIVYYVHLYVPFVNELHTLDNIAFNAASSSIARETDSPSSESWGSDSEPRLLVGAARGFRSLEYRGERTGGSAGSHEDMNFDLEKGVTASTTSDSTSTNHATSLNSYIFPEDVGDLADFKRQRQAEIQRRVKNVQQRARQESSHENSHRVPA